MTSQICVTSFMAVKITWFWIINDVTNLRDVIYGCKNYLILDHNVGNRNFLRHHCTPLRLLLSERYQQHLIFLSNLLRALLCVLSSLHWSFLHYWVLFCTLCLWPPLLSLNLYVIWLASKGEGPLLHTKLIRSKVHIDGMGPTAHVPCQ